MNNKIANTIHFTYQEFDDLPVLHHLKLWADEWLHHYQPGDSAHIAATFINENLYPISFADSAHTIHWIGYFNHKKQNDVQVDLSFSSYPQALAPGEEFKTMVSFVVPDIPGKNYLFFGAQVDDLSPTYQSNKMRFMIGGEEENQRRLTFDSYPKWNETRRTDSFTRLCMHI